MRSEIRIFKDSGITAAGKILPLAAFRLNRDVSATRIGDEKGSRFVAEAEKMLDETIPLLPLSLYRDFSKTTVRSRFEKPHHRRRQMLFYMTLAEAYERQGRFTEKIADTLWAIMEESSWVLPAHCYNSVLAPGTSVPEIYDETQMPGLDLYAGDDCATLALVRHLLRSELDAISPIICRRITHMIYLRGIRPFVSYPFGWTGEKGNRPNNWVTNITSNILFATALTEADTEMRERVADRAMRYLDNFTAGYPEDGSCDEGPGYWSGAAGNYFDCLEILEDLSDGAIRVYDHPLVRKMCEYIADVHIADKYYLNFADAHPRLEAEGKLILRCGEKCDSPTLRAFGRFAAAQESAQKYLFFGMCYRVYKNALLPEIHEADPVPARKSVWFAGNKIAILRENEEKGKGLFLAVKGGNNAESHNHKDVGCLVVYADGRPLIVDPSHGSYDNGFFGPTRYGRWFMKSSYHSIPCADGIEQGVGAAFASSDEQFDEANASLSLDLHKAFPAEAGITRMRRTASLQNGTVTVTDDVSLDHEGEILFPYVTLDEPKLLAAGKIALGEREITYDPDGVTASIEKVENTWLPYDDLNFRAVWGTDCLWRICLRTKARAKCVTLTIR